MRAAGLGCVLGLAMAAQFSQVSASTEQPESADLGPLPITASTSAENHGMGDAATGSQTSDATWPSHAAPVSAQAADTAQRHWWLSPGGKAYHFNRKKNYNEENYGLGLEYGNFESSWQAGFYRNSHRKDSYYAMYAWRPIVLDQAGHWRVGAVAGLVTGYKNRYFEDLMPIVMPTLAAEYRHIGLSFYAVPKISGLSPAMLMLHVRVRL